MRFYTLLLLIFTIFQGLAFRAEAAPEYLFVGNWGDSVATVQAKNPGVLERQSRLDNTRLLIYGAFVESRPAGVIYEFADDRLYRVSISIYINLKTITGPALLQTLTERIQAKLGNDLKLEDEKTAFDKSTQITHSGKYFSNENTNAFIFAKTWPEQEGRQIIILDFCDKSNPVAESMPQIFKDLFKR